MRFLLVDRIIQFTAGESLTAIKNISMDADYLEHHFPGQPVFPGVLSTEAMAQASGFLVMRSAELQEQREVIGLMTANNSRYLKLVRPGDQLVMQVELRHMDDNMAKTRVVSKVDDEIVSRADITVALGSHNATPDPDASRAHWYRMRQLLDPKQLARANHA